MGLESDQAVSLTTGRFATKLATLDPPVLVTGEAVRQWCANEAMAGVIRDGRKWRIVDLDAAIGWVRDNGKGESHHGGKRAGSGRSGADRSGDATTSTVEDSFAEQMATFERTESFAQSRHRAVREQAFGRYLDNQERVGLLVEKAAMHELVASRMGDLRRRLEQLPKRFATAVADRLELAPEPARRVREDAEAIVRAVVEEIVSAPLGIEGDDEQTEPDGQAGRADRVDRSVREASS